MLLNNLESIETKTEKELIQRLSKNINQMSHGQLIKLIKITELKDCEIAVAKNKQGFIAKASVIKADF